MTGPLAKSLLQPGKCDETTGECECYLQSKGWNSEETTVTFLKPISKVVTVSFLRHQRVYSQQDLFPPVPSHQYGLDFGCGYDRYPSMYEPLGAVPQLLPQRGITME